MNKNLITNFEREVLFQIILRLRQKRISLSRAQLISKEVMRIIKNNEDEGKFSQKMAKLCERYPEVMEAYITTFAEYERENKIESIENVLFDLKEIAKGGE